MKILIIDSGIGGVTIYNHMKKKYPNNEYTYYIDTKNFPYGDKKDNEIINILNNQILPITKGYDYIIIACNTLSISIVKNKIRLFSPTISMLDLHRLESINYIGKKVNILCTPSSKESGIWDSYYRELNVISGENLARDIQEGNSININSFLKNLKCDLPVILSCTHYNYIKSFIPNSVDITYNIDKLVKINDSFASTNIIFSDENKKFDVSNYMI